MPSLTRPTSASATVSTSPSDCRRSTLPAAPSTSAGRRPVPSGRGDTTFVAADTFSWLCGRHSLKFGGEYRQFLNNNFRLGPGTFNFPSIAAFLAGHRELLQHDPRQPDRAASRKGLSAFSSRTITSWRPNLTLELGLRYDWNMTPEERYGRFIVFDPDPARSTRLGQGVEDIYQQNNKNFQPRLGFAWDPFKDGKTSVRGAYAVLVDQPMTSVVTDTAANPPLAIPLTFTGTIRFENAIDLAQAAGLAPATVDRGFDNAYMQSWNLNVQREFVSGLAINGRLLRVQRHALILRRNINQPVDGVRPYPAVSASSAILPGTPLGNITQAESTGNSSYNALWVSASKTSRARPADQRFLHLVEVARL